MSNICNCSVPNCGCAGGMHTYLPYYKKLLSIVNPKEVMKWGPGPNTQVALDVGASVVSIEHDRKWIPKGQHSMFACVHLPVEHEDYVSTWTPGDVYFVDGRRRQECLNGIKSDSAIVCLHDAQRKRYQESLNRFPHVIHLIFGFAIASFDESVVRIAEQIRKEV